MAASKDSDSDCEVSSLHEAMLFIGKGLDTMEVKELVFLCKDSVSAKDREFMTALDLLDKLEMQGKIYEGNMKYLAIRFQRMNREDLRKICVKTSRLGQGQTSPPGFAPSTPPLRGSGFNGGGTPPTLKGPGHFALPSPSPNNLNTFVCNLGRKIPVQRTRSVFEAAAPSFGQSSTGLYNIDDGHGSPTMKMSKSYSGSPSLLDQPNNQSNTPNIFGEISKPTRSGFVPASPSSGQRPTGSPSLLDQSNIEDTFVNMSLQEPSPSSVKGDLQTVSPRDANDRQFGDLLELIMLEIESQLPEIDEQPLPSHGTKLYETEVKRRLIEAESQRSANRTAIIVYMYLYEYNRAMILYDDLRVKDGVRHLEEFHVSRRVDEHPDQVPVEEHCQRLFNANLSRMKRMGNEEGEHSNHKLGKLASLLHEIFSVKPESKGIILATMKVAATALVEFLRSSTLLKALPCRIEPLRLVGQGNIEDDCLTEAQQKQVLNSFRSDDGCNILVATDIAQEGLDMPACSFVIRYNFVSNEIGTVQSKGRAGKCFLIVERNSQNEKGEYENRSKVVRMEKAMEDLEAMVEEDRLAKIQEKQDARMKAIKKAEEQEKLSKTMHDLDKIAIHCKECSAYICKASELRRKGTAGHVTCISPDFGSKITEIKYNNPMRYRDTTTTGLIKCSTFTCKKNLGTMQKFLLLDFPLFYALKADSFKIIFSREGTAKVPKQWKKAGFTILEDEESDY